MTDASKIQPSSVRALMRQASDRQRQTSRGAETLPPWVLLTAQRGTGERVYAAGSEGANGWTLHAPWLSIDQIVALAAGVFCGESRVLTQPQTPLLLAIGLLALAAQDSPAQPNPAEAAPITGGERG